jgi:hypothetical protein
MDCVVIRLRRACVLSSVLIYPSLGPGAGIYMTAAVHHTSCRRLETDCCFPAMISHGSQRRDAVVSVVF